MVKASPVAAAAVVHQLIIHIQRLIIMVAIITSLLVAVIRKTTE